MALRVCQVFSGGRQAAASLDPSDPSDFAPDTLRSSSSEAPPAPRSRLLWVALAFVTTLVMARATGLGPWLVGDSMRTTIAQAGWWGVILFVAVFAAGTLMHVPGFVFVALAGAIYGGPKAFVAAYVGAVVSVAFTFVTVRRVGGQGEGGGLAGLKWRWIQWSLQRVDRRPVLAVVLLRSVLAVLPMLNYTLALSRIRFRDYMLGSAVGLLVPIAVMTWMTQSVMSIL